MQHEQFKTSLQDSQFVETAYSEGEPIQDQLSDVLDVAALSPDFTPLNEVDQQSTVMSFFTRRKNQLVKAGARMNALFQGVFSQDIDGMHFSAQDSLRAKFHPVQLAHNFRSNLGLAPAASLKKPTDPFELGANVDPILDNPILRASAYKMAIEGDNEALDYLKQHDRMFGERRSTNTDELKEALAYFSGYAAVRTIGLTAIVGANVLWTRLPGLSEEKLIRINGRIDRATDRFRYPAGSMKTTKEKAAYRQLRDTALEEHRVAQRLRDPFDF